MTNSQIMAGVLRIGLTELIKINYRGPEIRGCLWREGDNYWADLPGAYWKYAIETLEKGVVGEREVYHYWKNHNRFRAECCALGWIGFYGDVATAARSLFLKGGIVNGTGERITNRKIRRYIDDPSGWWLDMWTLLEDLEK